MSDNVLKKDFQQRDVQRLRNLVQGKYGEKTGEGVGYKKAEEFHKEGDVWEVDGRKWTIKNGIKQNITKLDKAKKSHVMPLFCPTCKGLMDVKFDKDYYNIHKKCFNCVLDFEFALRKAGLFEEYEKNIINSEIEGFISNFKDYVESQLTESNNSFITEQGDVEKWDGGLDKKRVLESLDKTIEHLEKMKK
jgi:hypothetical protein